MNIKDILHVGAHEAEEYSAYAYCNESRTSKTYWVEANKDLYNKLLKRFTNDERNFPICAVIGEKDGTKVTFNIANNGQSSSILLLGTHRKAHPEVHYVSSEERYTECLSSIFEVYNLPPDINFLNLDIQGAELQALCGLGQYLEQIDYIYTEININSLYKGCALHGEIKGFLEENGFREVEMELSSKHGWGDAFYIRRDLEEQ